ncbi:glutathione S-transferase N-terminal domain-containing protein [Idiomarina xiamenensis]|uniref:Glutathione S-transferase n=1 Tax=Idiomarina xiamenensis 10-D-4 TaxID=740709 RepID=K2J9H9_9GAMM|nr:glutathione S-transferase N-terminal domain-containing protein [Idiomarina xiamenensis]EKE79896.1 glutathione S-transferase [Idiomarina xiamenensis 10-D-4]
MYDLYYFPTPNGHKVTLLLEECELPYQIHTVDITAGDQFEADFLRISPNNKMPALVDQKPSDGGKPLALFESGEILFYLAEKHGRFLAPELRLRHQTMQWLFWQMGGLGPMLGQNHHFNQYAPEPIEYAQQRYIKESKRLYKVLDKQLQGRDFIVGEYSIADMASHPWCKGHAKQQIDIDQYPNVKAWLARIDERPASQRAYALADNYNRSSELSDQARHNMFQREAD